MEISDKYKAFLKRVDELDLRFPVAEIVKKTGESKGNVSAFVNSKREPSENFLNRFHKAFPEKKPLTNDDHVENRLNEPEVDSYIISNLKANISLLKVVIEEKNKTIEDNRYTIDKLKIIIDSLGNADGRIAASG